MNRRWTVLAIAGAAVLSGCAYNPYPGTYAPAPGYGSGGYPAYGTYGYPGNAYPGNGYPAYGYPSYGPSYGSSVTFGGTWGGGDERRRYPDDHREDRRGDQRGATAPRPEHHEERGRPVNLGRAPEAYHQTGGDRVARQPAVQHAAPAGGSHRDKDADRNDHGR